jgi:hypothetical protein
MKLNIVTLKLYIVKKIEILYEIPEDIRKLCVKQGCFKKKKKIIRDTTRNRPFFVSNKVIFKNNLINS